MFPLVLLWVFSVVNIWKVSGKAINVPLKKFQLKSPISNKEVVTDRSSFERVQTIASGLEKKEKINTNIKDFNKVLPHSSKDRPNFVPPLTNLHQKQLLVKGISPTDSRKTVNIQRESNAEAIAKSRFSDDSDINRKDQQRKYFDVRSTRDRKLNNLVSERNEMFPRLPQVSKPPPRPFYQSYHSSKKKTNSASTSLTSRRRSPLDSSFDPTAALTSSLSDVYSSTVNRASTLFNGFMSPAGYSSGSRDSSGSILQSTHPIFYDPTTESRVHRNRTQQLRNDSLIHFNMSAVSWNLAELSPTPKDCSFLHDLRHDDFILLGVQECEAVKPRREEGRRSRKWRQLRQKSLSSTHNCLAEHKFGGMQLAVHCHKRLSGLVKKVQVVEVACGLGNVLGNKGAIAVLVKLRNDKTLCFINCHLAAHEKMVQQRNKDYKRIVTQILAQAHPDFLPVTTTAAASADVSSGNNDDDIRRTDNRSVKKSDRKAVKKMLNKRQRLSKGVLSDQQARARIKPLNETFHGVVFMGDFNYRLDVPRLEVNRLHDRYNKLKKVTANNSNNATASNSALVKQDMRYAKDVDTRSPAFRAFSDQLECLLDLDQLSAERRRGRVFKGFQEGEISFPPTYKYDKRSNLFDTSSKARCPAWTDRILYSFRLKDSAATAASLVAEKAPVVKLKDYYTLDVRTSDHRPVVAHFDVNL